MIGTRVVGSVDVAAGIWREPIPKFRVVRGEDGR